MADEQKLSVEDVRAIAQSISRRRAVFAEEPVEHESERERDDRDGGEVDDDGAPA